VPAESKKSTEVDCSFKREPLRIVPDDPMAESGNCSMNRTAQDGTHFMNGFRSLVHSTLRLLAVRLQLVLWLLVLSLTGEVFGPVAGDVKRYLYNGELLENPISRREQEWLEARKQEQLRTLRKFKVDHNFQFQVRVEESQITFKHNVVDDAGRDYKAIHYDHGSGLAAADVDLDGLIDLYFVNQLGPNEFWRNLGGGRFENITQLAGVALAGRVNVSASFADIDNDGDPDLYVTTVRTGNFSSATWPRNIQSNLSKLT
jgi:hypothetical protein